MLTPTAGLCAHLHEQVGQAGEQVLVGFLGAGARRVLQQAPPEGLAEVEGLQHAVRVARVPKVLQPKVALRLCGVVHAAGMLEDVIPTGSKLCSGVLAAIAGCQEMTHACLCHVSKLAPRHCHTCRNPQSKNPCCGAACNPKLWESGRACNRDAVPGKSESAFSSLEEVTPMLDTRRHRPPSSSSGSKLGSSARGGRQKYSMVAGFFAGLLQAARPWLRPGPGCCCAGAGLACAGLPRRLPLLLLEAALKVVKLGQVLWQDALLRGFDDRSARFTGAATPAGLARTIAVKPQGWLAPAQGPCHCSHAMLLHADSTLEIFATRTITFMHLCTLHKP